MKYFSVLLIFIAFSSCCGTKKAIESPKETSKSDSNTQPIEKPKIKDSSKILEIKIEKEILNDSIDLKREK